MPTVSPRRVLAACLIASAVFLPIALSSSSPATAHHRLRCPTGVVEQHASIDFVIDLTRRLFVRGKTITVQGRRYRLTDRNTPVVAALLVGPPSYVLPEAAGFWREAVSRCGTETARRSWAIVLNFALRNVSSDSDRTVFFVKTTGGWRYY
jgi:hypothetical protein